MAQIDTLDAPVEHARFREFFKHLNYFGANMCDFVAKRWRNREALEGLLQFMRDYDLGFMDMNNLALGLAYMKDDLSIGFRFCTEKYSDSLPWKPQRVPGLSSAHGPLLKR